MFLIALDPEEGEIEFDGNLWPPEPSLEGFREVITQEARYLEMLSLEIGELGEAGFDLSLTGFDEFELGELFAERTQGRTDPDVCYRAISSFNDPGIVVHGVALNRSRCS